MAGSGAMRLERARAAEKGKRSVFTQTHDKAEDYLSSIGQGKRKRKKKNG